MDKQHLIKAAELLLRQDHADEETLSLVDAMIKEADKRTGPTVGPNIYEERRTPYGVEARLFRPGEKVAGDEPNGRLGDYLRHIITGSTHQLPDEYRQMATSPGSAGGFLVPEPLAAYVIDLARAKSVCVAGGMQTLLMESTTLNIATITADPTAAWVAENDAITESAPTLDQLSLCPMKLGCLVRASRELLSDSPNAGEVIEEAIRGAMGAELDRAMLLGSGVGEPRGLLDWIPLANQVDMLGNPITDYSQIVTACQRIAEANGPLADRLSMVCSPAVYYAYEGLTDAMLGNPLVGPDCFKAMKKLVTTSMPDNTIIVGDMTQMLMGLRLPLTVETSDAGGEGAGGDAFSRYQVLIRAVLRADLVVKQAGFFSAIINVG